MSDLSMRYFFEFKEILKHKYVEGLIKLFYFTVWFIAFTYTVYEMATKGIW